MVAGARTFTLEDSLLAPQSLNPPPTRHALLAFLLALTAILHIGTVGWGHLFDGAEGQLAGGAREIVQSGHWLVPTNDGVPLLQGPPLASWLVAGSYKIFGLTVTAARLPIALAMIGSVALTFLIGERLAGYWRGFAAGLILLCSGSAFLFGRLVTPDSILTLFICGALYCVLRGYQQQKFRRGWFAGVWILVGLAALTKGAVAIVYPTAICIVLALFFREARLRFRALLHWTNFLLPAAIVVPWFAFVENQFPGFLSRFPIWSDAVAGVPGWRWLLLPLAAWFPAIFLILPALVVAPRKIFRPGEFSFADFLPVAWIVVGLLAVALTRDRNLLVTVTPGLALLAACGWERTSRPLRAAGIALATLVGVAIAAFGLSRPQVFEPFFARSLNGAPWLSFQPLAQITIAALLVFGIAALVLIKQRGAIMLILAVAAMVPAGFCLIESEARAAPFFSLADAAEYLNPRLGHNGQVIFEGSLRNGSSLTFYLEKNFFFVNQTPGPFEQSAEARNKYLDEHYVLEAWDRSDPIYLIIDESRVAHWRRLITDRVHIYHQVTTCGSRVVLSNQM
jgi:4-amino-4-deoxy-L-arabinose transferase-like glycosyltransferase